MSRTAVFHPFLLVVALLLSAAQLHAASALPIGTIQLRMDPTDAAVLLRKDPYDKSSFAVTLLDGERELKGRIKVTGSSSRSMKKRSLYVKLEKGSKWNGQSRISLNGMGSDPSLMRNRLVWDLYHAIGVVGPDTAYYRVYLNGVPQGIYLQLEWIENKMFERKGLGGDGELYHPQDSHFCGDLDKHNRYDIDDCWLKFSPPFEDFSSLQALIDGINVTPISEFDHFVESNFESDSVINWLAVNVLVADGDTYNKNYFLYRSKASGKWTVIPWDYDLTFGRTFDTYLFYPDSVFNSRFMYFYPPELGAYNPLKEKLLRNPALLARFRQRLAHLMGLKEETGKPGFALFSTRAMMARVSELRAQLLPEVLQDPYLRDNLKEFDDNVEALTHFVRGRNGYLKTAVFGEVPWNPELAYWRPETSPRPIPYPDKLQASAQGTGSVAVVADGYGYLLALLTPADPYRNVNIYAESKLGQPPVLLPPGQTAAQCIQRSWSVTLAKTNEPVLGSLTLEYLEENALLHELGAVNDESRLRLWRFDGSEWQELPTRINTLANTLTSTDLVFTPEQTQRFVACMAQPHDGEKK